MNAPHGLARAVASTVPDYVEPVEAWRVWRVGMHEGRLALHSAYADAPWEPGVPLGATCAKLHRSVRRPWRMEASRHAAPDCLLYTSPSPRDRQKSRMPSSA